MACTAVHTRVLLTATGSGIYRNPNPSKPRHAMKFLRKFWIGNHCRLNVKSSNTSDMLRKEGAPADAGDKILMDL
jgi:hypothetical protein